MPMVQSLCNILLPGECLPREQGRWKFPSNGPLCSWWCRGGRKQAAPIHSSQVNGPRGSTQRSSEAIDQARRNAEVRHLWWQLKWPRVKSLEATKVSAVTGKNIWVLRCLLHQTLIWFLHGEVSGVSSHRRSCISRKCSAPGKAGNIKRKKRSRDGDCSEGNVDKEWWEIKDWIGVGTENQGEIKGKLRKKMKGYWKKRKWVRREGQGDEIGRVWRKYYETEHCIKRRWGKEQNTEDQTGKKKKKTFRIANLSIQIRGKWKGIWTLPPVQAEFV